MSRCFRAVTERWNDDPGYMPPDLEAEGAAIIIEELSEGAGIQASAETYGSNEVVWVAEGEKFLEYLKIIPDTNKQILEFYGITEDEESDALTVSFILALAAHADTWKSSIDKDGSLRIYIDQA